MVDDPLRRDGPQTRQNRRFAYREFEVTALTDGHIMAPIDVVLPDGSAAGRAEVLEATGEMATGLVVSKCNVPLLRRADELALVDVRAASVDSADVVRRQDNPCPVPRPSLRYSEVRSRALWRRSAMGLAGSRSATASSPRLAGFAVELSHVRADFTTPHNGMSPVAHTTTPATS